MRDANIYIIKSIIVILIISGTFFYSCKPNNQNKLKDTAISSNGIPIIQFDTTYYDFGTLMYGEQVAYTFKFRNTGDADLLILDAYSTCGCTVPSYSKKPIPPGGDGKIEVLFNSEGKHGLQYKTVTLKLNTNISEKSLVIKANVIEK